MLSVAETYSRYDQGGHRDWIQNDKILLLIETRRDLEEQVKEANLELPSLLTIVNGTVGPDPQRKDQFNALDSKLLELKRKLSSLDLTIADIEKVCLSLGFKTPTMKSFEDFKEGLDKDIQEALYKKADAVVKLLRMNPEAVDYIYETHEFKEAKKVYDDLVSRKREMLRPVLEAEATVDKLLKEMV